MTLFFDTCIIISAFDKRDRYHEISGISLGDKDEKIISIYQHQVEIPNLFIRKNKVFLEAIKFMENKENRLDFSGLTDKEKIILKKLLSEIQLGNENELTILEKQEELDNIRRKVKRFIQTVISRKVIPIEEIKKELIDMIKNINGNKADAKVIASAIQEHQQKELVAFTLDKKDWKILPLKEKIEEIGFKCPEVRFLR